MERLNVEHILAEIDAALERPPVTIEEALQEAVEAGRMDIKTAEECLEAYLRSFHNKD